jgi:cysteine synthase A
MKIYTNLTQLIGNTPLLHPLHLSELHHLNAQLLLKLECFNPGGSVKDRVALAMIEDAEREGKLLPGGTIIEPTSGNTGIGIASICSRRGYKVILTMPETMSLERQKLLKAYGAEIVLTDGKLGMNGAIEKAKEINKNTPNSIILSQFDNPSNIDAHYYTTAPEIYEDLGGNIDIFVAGIGTGGTLSGCAKFFKEKNNDIKVFGVEPSGSPLITKGQVGKHNLQGIGANFIPKNYLSSYCDLVETATEEDAYFYANLLAKKEGILVGISSGAALSVGIQKAKLQENKGKNIVVILPDTGSRYLSTELFNN